MFELKYYISDGITALVLGLLLIVFNKFVLKDRWGPIATFFVFYLLFFCYWTAGQLLGDVDKEAQRIMMKNLTAGQGGLDFSLSEKLSVGRKYLTRKNFNFYALLLAISAFYTLYWSIFFNLFNRLLGFINRMAHNPSTKT